MQGILRFKESNGSIRCRVPTVLSRVMLSCDKSSQIAIFPTGTTTSGCIERICCMSIGRYCLTCSLDGGLCPFLEAPGYEAISASKWQYSCMALSLKSMLRSHGCKYVPGTSWLLDGRAGAWPINKTRLTVCFFVCRFAQDEYAQSRCYV
jgi:hypothetical protein